MIREAASAFVDALGAPKRAVDAIARDYSRQAGLPVSDSATVGEMMSAIAGAQNEGRGGAADAFITGLGDVGMDPAMYATGALGQAAFRAVTPAERLVKITRWGRPGLESGDWAMRGGRRVGNYISSGKFLPRWEGGTLRAPANFFRGQTFRVPAGSLRTGAQGVIQGSTRYLP